MDAGCSEVVFVLEREEMLARDGGTLGMGMPGGELRFGMRGSRSRSGSDIVSHLRYKFRDQRWKT